MFLCVYVCDWVGRWAEQNENTGRPRHLIIVKGPHTIKSNITGAKICNKHTFLKHLFKKADSRLYEENCRVCTDLVHLKTATIDTWRGKMEDNGISTRIG